MAHHSVGPASHGVISAGDPQTAEAGAKLLRLGGNAVDAAVAAAFAAFVCELPLCSPLGGGVCVVETSEAQAPVAFDMFARTPGLGRDPLGHESEPRDFEAVAVSFGAATQVFHVGRASVALPLALTGLLEVHRRYGSRPLGEVLAPAIALGRDGYVLGPGVAYVFDILVPIVTRTPDCHRLFSHQGAIAREGAVLFNKDMASTLEAIARHPKDEVRRIYELLAEEIGPPRGGLITREDIDRSTIIDQHAPVTVAHGGWKLSTMPSPSTGGVLVALGVRMLEGVGAHPFLSRAHVGMVAKAQEMLLAERADGDFVDRVRDPKEVRAMLADERVRVAQEKARNNLLGSTTQISAIDDRGMAISLTLTNGEGSGHVLPGTGMITNNLLGEEDLHPRGFHKDAPGAPLSTMMAPTLLSRGGDRIALGSGGSNRLRTAILQVIIGLIEHGVSPLEAVSAPRLHVEPGPRLAFEASGLSEEVKSALVQAYASPPPAAFSAPNLYFGGVHLAMRTNGVLDGVGDPRRGGARVVT